MSRTHRDGGFGGAWEKHERKYSFRRERMLTREFCTRVKIDEEAPYTYDIEEKTPMWGKGWTGYWRPMRRWLASRLGQPWNQVYSDLIAKLKTFTSTKDELSIRHYVTNLVEISPDPRFGDSKTSWFKYDFYVDDNGLLQQKKYVRNKRTKLPRCNMNKVAAWLDGRAVGKVGEHFYWFTHTTGTKKHGRRADVSKVVTFWTKLWYEYQLVYRSQYSEPIYNTKHEVVGSKLVWRDMGCPSKQDKKLTTEELEFWNKLPDHIKKMIMEFTPVYDGERTSHPYWYYF